MTVVPLPPLQPPGQPMRPRTAETAAPPESDQLSLRTRLALGLLGIVLAWGVFAAMILGVAKLFG